MKTIKNIFTKRVIIVASKYLFPMSMCFVGLLWAFGELGLLSLSLPLMIVLSMLLSLIVIGLVAIIAWKVVMGNQ